MKSTLFFLLFLFLISNIFAQKLTIKSSKGNTGIEGVLIINKAGELIAKTDITGTIQPPQNLVDDWYILNHQNIKTDTLFTNKIINNEYKIEQTREIIIKPSTKDFLVGRIFQCICYQ